jgi:hyperosmotically inducible protein
MKCEKVKMRKTMTLGLVLASAALVIALPNAKAADRATETSQTTTTSESRSMQDHQGSAAADNTKINTRDRRAGEVTADQQSSGTADMEITRSIRKSIIAEKQLSIYAHNIKIITIGGVVTLKGPVKSQAEKDNAEKIAKAAHGVASVDNQLSIKR